MRQSRGILFCPLQMFLEQILWRDGRRIEECNQTATRDDRIGTEFERFCKRLRRIDRATLTAQIQAKVTPRTGKIGPNANGCSVMRLSLLGTPSLFEQYSQVIVRDRMLRLQTESLLDHQNRLIDLTGFGQSTSECKIVARQIGGLIQRCPKCCDCLLELTNVNQRFTQME